MMDVEIFEESNYILYMDTIIVNRLTMVRFYTTTVIVLISLESTCITASLH
jgi:hypothetical protein